VIESKIVVTDPSTERAGKLVMGILALIAEFENDIRRERQMDGIAKAKEPDVKYGRKRKLTGPNRSDQVPARGAGDGADHHQAYWIQQGERVKGPRPSLL
jgi:DNA invertase Pin-like site-specific DNA recombinase